MATTPEEEEIIKKRFLTQTTVTRGEPPLKRLAQRSVPASPANVVFFQIGVPVTTGVG